MPKSHLIGIIHGVAGSGSLIALVATTLDNVGMATTFILLFGLGSVFGMIIVSSLIGLPILLSEKITTINLYLRFGTAGISLILGANILYEIGVLNYLKF